MSLSTWFNDYLFTPMLISFRNYETLGIVLAVLVTFFMSGLWHGAGWSFIAYGVVNGIAVCYEIKTKKIRKQVLSYLHPVISNFLTRFLALSFIVLSWILFRSENLGKARIVYSKIFQVGERWSFVQFFNGNGPVNFFSISLSLILFYIFSRLFKRLDFKFDLYFLLLISFTIIFFGKNDSSQFIYFQF